MGFYGNHSGGFSRVGTIFDCFLKALELFEVIFRNLRGSQEVVETLRRARQASMAARRGPGE